MNTDEYFRAQITPHLERIAKLFVPGARMTLVVRIPGDDDADVILTSDELSETIKAIRRRADLDNLPEARREP